MTDVPIPSYQSSGAGKTVTTRLLDSGGSDLNPTFPLPDPVVTNIIDPTPDALVLCFWERGGIASATPLPPAVTGCGLTWTYVTHVSISNTSIGVHAARGGSPTSGPVTITWGGTQLPRACYMITEHENVPGGASPLGAIVQSLALGALTGGTFASDIASPGNATVVFAATNNSPAGHENDVAYSIGHASPFAWLTTLRPVSPNSGQAFSRALGEVGAGQKTIVYAPGSGYGGGDIAFVAVEVGWKGVLGGVFGGHLRQKQRSSEQDKFRAADGNRYQ